MAILKHINVHNSNYHDFITYVLFQHDSQARPIYNERHKMILRENVLIDSINTTPWSYNIDCQISNRQYKKNREPRDIKSHHFILSFDPKDAECGLTLEKAQELGMDFARKHFSGHQCVIATHDDGNNHSHNYHVHISFNSLRIKDIPQPEYSDIERDSKAGYKFHPTDQCMAYLKSEVEKMCREQGLHQIDLNKRAKQNIPDKEYWAAHRGQERLNQKNEAIRSIGGKPAETKFQTELSRIRQAIDDVKAKCSTVEEFMIALKQEYSITVTESRGRWSYLPENRQCPITWRRLGDDYSRAAIETFI
ncbi:MAG: relaxase/mobilization nuclease domain-containing protein, partial [Oscillospiraceae bacterium]|nr:relaxase/mobilization nuclease domain-containing protein [Oscillospiraceae bacterium]